MLEQLFDRLKEGVQKLREEFEMILKGNVKLRNSLGQYGKIGKPSGSFKSKK